MNKTHSVQDLKNLCDTFGECAEYLKLISSWTLSVGETSCPGGGSLDQGRKIVSAWNSLSDAEKNRAEPASVENIFRTLLIHGLNLVTDIVTYQALYAKARKGDLQFCIDLLRPCMHRLNGMSCRPLPLEGVCTQMYDQVSKSSFTSSNSSVYCEMSEV